MAEEFVNKANAAAFLSAYNKIDAQLRALYNFGSGQSFTDIVRRCAEKNAVVRRYEDELAAQDTVNSAWKNLLKAMADMMLRPDKGLLEDLIAQAEGLREADYEEQSFAAVQSALADAKAVLADENATEEEVRVSAEALEGAMAKLTAAASETSPAKDAVSAQNSEAGIKAVKTGDETAVWIFLSAAVSAAAVLLIGMKKKLR